MMKKIVSLFICTVMLLSFAISMSAENVFIPNDPNWEITASSELSPGNIKRAFDGDTKTYWHTNYTAEGNKITSHDEVPHIITVNFGKEMTVAGWRYTPRTGSASGVIKAYNIYASSDGKKFEKILSGTFDIDISSETEERPPVDAFWGQRKMKAIKIEITESVKGYGTAAEIAFYSDGKADSSTAANTKTDTKTETGTKENVNANAKIIETDPNWEITASSELSPGNIKKAFDGETKTFWHTNYTAEGNKITSHDEVPHIITVNFGKEMTVAGWRYTPRTGSATGVIKAYNIYASSDGKKFEKIYSGTFDIDTSSETEERLPVSAFWGEKKMKALKIEITESVKGYGTAAEIAFYSDGKADASSSTNTKTDTDTKTETKTDTDASGERKASDGTAFYDKTGWTATASSELSSSNGIAKVLDNNIKTFWHTKYTAEGATIVSKDTPPFDVNITLPEAVETSGIVITPRADGNSGRPLTVNVYASESDNGELTLIKENAALSSDGRPQEIFFKANLKIKRIRLEIISSIGGYGVFSEFDLMVKNDSYKTMDYAEFVEYDASNVMYEISREGMTAESSAPNWTKVENIFDNNELSFWQTDSVKDDWPIVLTVDLKDVYKIKEIRVIPRNTADLHGAWFKVTINGSADNNDWFEIKKSLTFDQDVKTRIITFDEEVTVRYIEFCIEEAGGSRAGAAEISFWQTKEAKDEYELSKSVKYSLKIGSNVIATEKGNDKTETTIDVAPYIKNGSTMIPLRGLLEQMGAEVSWDGENKTVMINNGENSITLQIWNYLVYIYDEKSGKETRYTLLNPPVISDSRTFIPIRFVSEQLGYNVAWDGESQTVTITK